MHGPPARPRAAAFRVGFRSLAPEWPLEHPRCSPRHTPSRAGHPTPALATSAHSPLLHGSRGAPGASCYRTAPAKSLKEPFFFQPLSERLGEGQEGARTMP
ncbi:hypothetical protein NN561_000009 [Cricetulus griseus]